MLQQASVPVPHAACRHGIDCKQHTQISFNQQAPEYPQQIEGQAQHRDSKFGCCTCCLRMQHVLIKTLGQQAADGCLLAPLRHMHSRMLSVIVASAGPRHKLSCTTFR